MSTPTTTADVIAQGTLEIRRMRESDVSGVLAIESVSFGQHHWSPDSYHSELKNPMARYFVLLAPGQTPEVVGYCGFWLVFDEVHITTIAVHPSRRGQSLGELMLAKALTESMHHSAKWVTLEVRASNVSAQNLYYKYGFHSMGVRPRYYQDNHEDAVIMTTDNILDAQYRRKFKDHLAHLSGRLSGLPKGFEPYVPIVGGASGYF